MAKLFDGLDEESFAKIQKILTDGRRENKKQKHKKKRKRKFDSRTGKIGKAK
tara:strand:- start:536 stop:691 length:156 start_codon:yes stop_codon:yes gene_type:complete